MKVIAVDNFDRDHVSDRLVASGLDAAEALAYAERCNAAAGVDDDWYYKAVEDGYKLHVWEP